jgi:hypothetical protein
MTSVFLADLLAMLEPLKWFMVLAVVLIFCDLRFGIQAARARGDTIRFSRAARRTGNKIIDYICWILVAGAIGMSFGVYYKYEVLPLIVLLVIYGIEINSLFSNYFEARGKDFNINIFKIFEKKTDMIEFKKKEKNVNEKNKENENHQQNHHS